MALFDRLRDLIPSVESIGLDDAIRTALDSLKAAVTTVDPVDVPGHEKKAAVMAFAGDIYDVLTSKIDIPYVPAAAEQRIVWPALKPFAMSFASGFVEWILVQRKPV